MSRDTVEMHKPPNMHQDDHKNGLLDTPEKKADEIGAVLFL